MLENETPQPITREEFEAGVEFFEYNKLDPMNIETYRLKMFNYPDSISRCILNRHNDFYCHIQKVEDDGFTFINFTFKYQTEGKILFKNCFKSEIQ